MPHWPRLLTAARTLLAANEPALFATLIGTQGPSYRPPGSIMIAGPNLTPINGISGGCLEDYVIREGLQLARKPGGGQSAVLSFDTTHDPENPRPVPGCGGQLHILLEPLSQHHLALLQAIHTARIADIPCVLTTEVQGHTPSDIDVTHMFLTSPLQGEVGGTPPGEGRRSRPETGLAQAAWQSQKTHQHRPAESHWQIAHYIAPPLRLIILGAGDDAQALAAQAKLLGWHITLIDRRTRLATRARHPHPDEILAEPWPTALPKIPPSPRTVIAIMTHSIPDDAEVLPWALTTPSQYVGLLGPTSRRDVVLQEAKSQIDNRKSQMPLHSPIGLDLGEKSPEAIALSITAEILAVTNGRTARPLST